MEYIAEITPECAATPLNDIGFSWAAEGKLMMVWRCDKIMLQGRVEVLPLFPHPADGHNKKRNWRVFQKARVAGR
jgi:hypothetical protein